MNEQAPSRRTDKVAEFEARHIPYLLAFFFLVFYVHASTCLRVFALLVMSFSIEI